MELLFCCDPLKPERVDADYAQEFAAASAMGLRCSLVDFEALVDDDNPQRAVRKVPRSESLRRALYRGWMLSLEGYESLYAALQRRGVELVNTPEQYRHCHHLPESYALIAKRTPRSLWVSADATPSKITKALTGFSGRPVIIKDYVKSLKHYWDEACFIPDSSNTDSVMCVVERFRELRGDLVGGLVFREFVHFEALSTHSKSGMPLTVEYRLFYFEGKLVACYPYWDEGDYAGQHPPVEQFADVAAQVQSKFFTMDIGKLKNGQWCIVELGDGQVAGLPENADPRGLFELVLQVAGESRLYVRGFQD